MDEKEINRQPTGHRRRTAAPLAERGPEGKAGEPLAPWRGPGAISAPGRAASRGQAVVAGLDGNGSLL